MSPAPIPAGTDATTPPAAATDAPADRTQERVPGARVPPSPPYKHRAKACEAVGMVARAAGSMALAGLGQAEEGGGNVCRACGGPRFGRLVCASCGAHAKALAGVATGGNGGDGEERPAP